MAESKTLAAALLEAQRAIQPVAKDARNEFSRYDYASAESIIVEARRALHTAGVTVYRRAWELWSQPAGPVVVATFVVTNGTETVEAVCPFPIVECKGKPLDKALATALTSGLAYWLRDLLLIPRCGEEMDQRDDAAHEPATPPEPEKPKPPTPKPPEPPRTLTQLGKLLMTMAGGDKAAAGALCQELLGVTTLKDFKGYLPDAIEKVWDEYKDRQGATGE